MDGNTNQNHTSDDAFKARLRPPIHTVQTTIGRGSLGPGSGAVSIRPAPTVTSPTIVSSTNAKIRAACTTTPTLGQGRVRGGHDARYCSGSGAPLVPAGGRQYGRTAGCSRATQVTSRSPQLLGLRTLNLAVPPRGVSEGNQSAWLRLQHVTGPTVGSRDFPDSALQPTPTLSL